MNQTLNTRTNYFFLYFSDDYDNSDLFTEQNPEDHANVIPDDKSDLYFEEDKKKTKKVKKDKKDKKDKKNPDVDYDNLLYEYYNEVINSLIWRKKNLNRIKKSECRKNDILIRTLL